MEYRYYFVVMWGQVPTESGAAVASFQCGSTEDLALSIPTPLSNGIAMKARAQMKSMGSKSGIGVMTT